MTHELPAPAAGSTRVPAYSRIMLSALRARVRDARDLPLLRPLVARIDRLWWARTIERADIVDLDYVRAQVGDPLSARAAIRRYVDGGSRHGLRLSPLFVDTAVGDHLPEAWRVPALYAYLVADPRGLQVSPLWDAVAYGERHPDSLDAPGGPLAHAWHRRHDHSLPFGPSAAPAAASWSDLSRVIVDAAHRARVGGEVAPLPGTAPLGRELLIALGPEEWDFDESLAEAVRFAEQEDHGVAIAVMDDRSEDWVLASLFAASHPRVRVSRRRHDDPSAALDELLMSSRADVVIVRGPNETLTAAAASALAGRVEAAGAGAVVGPVGSTATAPSPRSARRRRGACSPVTRAKTCPPSPPRATWRCPPSRGRPSRPTVPTWTPT